ncbi:MAG: hypothetical protein KF803_10910 [Cyclobacteriaceae bacterium]|nr:hypothetical protein [Cyclobacteriaceae bacterium]
MKKLFFSMLGLLLLSAVTVFAQATVKQEAKEELVAIEQSKSMQDEKVEIKADELPQPVRSVLSSEAYKDWSIEKAYHHKTNNHYEVKLKKGTESKSVKFDKDGNVV